MKHSHPFALVLAVLMVFTGCQTVVRQPLLNPPRFSESNQDGFWQTLPLSETPLNEDAVQRYLTLCQTTGADAVLVVYRGQIVTEWYAPAYHEPVYAMSSTKAVSALVVGIAVDEGRLQYGQRVSEVLPSWSGERRDRVTVETILQHRSGFRRDVAKRNPIGNTESLTDWVLRLAPESAVGERFEYSNEAVQLLDPLISTSTGTPTETYAMTRLFHPIGALDTTYKLYLGKPWMYAELLTTPRDMARLGLVMLNRGLWQGKRIVSEDFVSRATTPSRENPSMGYLWWLLKPQNLPGFYASGSQNTDIYVFPEAELVIVRTQFPKGGNPSVQESGDYFRQALPLFRLLTTPVVKP